MPVYLEDIRLIKYNKIFMMDIDKFDIKLQKIVTSRQFDAYIESRDEYFKSKITEFDFFNALVSNLGQQKVKP